MAKKPRKRKNSSRDSALEKVDASAQLVLQKLEAGFSGPIPPPDMLKAYGEILPDAPVRIIDMAEKEQAHRHLMDETIARIASGGRVRGQIIGGLIALASLGSAVYCIHKGQSAFAVAAMLLCVTFVVAPFVARKFGKPD